MMFSLIIRFCRRSLFKLYEHTWLVIFITLAVLYLGGLYVMAHANETAILDNYSWWFVVTITTVGYGDFFPTTTVGRLGAGVIMFLGIGIIGLAIGKLAEFVLEFANKKARGQSRMSYTDHTIIFGYRNGSTEKMVKELLIDNPDEKIVLCSKDQDSNPLLKHNVHFIQGELASDDVLERSNAKHARNVIIHGKDDNQTFFTAYAFRELNTSAHMVCCLIDEDHADKIKRLPADDPALNQVILPANIYLMAQELQDRESCSVVQNLISNLTGDNMYRLDITDDMQISLPFKDFFVQMKEKYGVTVLAVKNKEVILNPSLDLEIKSGMSVFYIAPARLKDIQLDVA